MGTFIRDFVIKLSLTFEIKGIIILIYDNKERIMENKNTDNKNKFSAPSGMAGVIAIIVVGIFVLCVVFLMAKGLFTSNSKEVPAGLDTATINTDTSSEPEKADSSAVVANNDLSSASDSETDSSESLSESDSTADDSSQSEYLAQMYVTEYAYLHTAPANDAENIVCMYPGVVVNVLEYEDNGYVKITFQNIDGPLTGYIYKDYLASYSSTTTTAASTYAQYSDTNAYGYSTDGGYTEANGQW